MVGKYPEGREGGVGRHPTPPVSGVQPGGSTRVSRDRDNVPLSPVTGTRSGGNHRIVSGDVGGPTGVGTRVLETWTRKRDPSITSRDPRPGSGTSVQFQTGTGCPEERKGRGT